jgi:hypothetical protein
VQACVQCGLSIGELATFCPVCGTRVGDGAAVAAAVEAGAQLAPDLDADAGANFAPEASESETDSQPGPEPAAGLVTELESDHRRESGADPEDAHLDAGPVMGHGAILDAEPDADRAELVADLASGHEAEAETAPDAEASAEPEEAEVEEPAVAEEPEPAEAEESPEQVREVRIAEIAALLEFAGRCEEVNVARAAAVYGEAIVGCLEVTDDPLGTEPVRKELLRGFDRLSFVLERQGLSQEALAVVDDAASLGLLDGENGMAAPQCGVLRDRREGLRRALYGDWAQL